MKRLAFLAVAALALAGCAATPPDANVDAFMIVASTDVYGQIAQEIAGDTVDVVSIIDSPAKDPHEYELTARDQLAIRTADLIIRNGGGYDPFIDAGIDATGVDAPVVTAVDHSPDDGNEHVWYDPFAISGVAAQIAAQLTSALPDLADAIRANLAAFTDGIRGLEADLAAIAEANRGAEVFVTEPVPLDLLDAAGLVNVTPEAFSEAVEEGHDVPPAIMLRSLDLLTPATTDLVIVNAQTGGAETDQVIAAAERAGIPVLSFSETLPTDTTYLAWMHDNAAAVAEALA